MINNERTQEVGTLQITPIVQLPTVLS